LRKTLRQNAFSWPHSCLENMFCPLLKPLFPISGLPISLLPPTTSVAPCPGSSHVSFLNRIPRVLYSRRKTGTQKILFNFLPHNLAKHFTKLLSTQWQNGVAPELLFKTLLYVAAIFSAMCFRTSRSKSRRLLTSENRALVFSGREFGFALTSSMP